MYSGSARTMHALGRTETNGLRRHHPSLTGMTRIYVLCCPCAVLYCGRQHEGSKHMNARFTISQPNYVDDPDHSTAYTTHEEQAWRCIDRPPRRGGHKQAIAICRHPIIQQGGFMHGSQCRRGEKQSVVGALNYCATCPASRKHGSPKARRRPANRDSER